MYSTYESNIRGCVMLCDVGNVKCCICTNMKPEQLSNNEHD